MIPAVLILIISLVITIGSQTFLSPCIHEDGSFGSCHWAGRALCGVGIVLCFIAVFSLWKENARFGGYLSAIPTCVLGILMPGKIIDLCHMSTMRCRMVMQPAMIILFSIALFCTVTGAIMTRRK